MSPLQQALVDRLRVRMKHYGWNQAGLCDWAGISEKHLSQMLTGKAEGSLAMWSHLFDVCEGGSATIRVTVAARGH